MTDSGVFRRERILIPGWAGELTPEEVAYIKSMLKESRELRRRWGFKTTRISEAQVRKVAMEGPALRQKPTEAHQTASK